MSGLSVGLSEAGLRRQRDKGATEQMTTLNRLRSRREGTPLSAANERKLDSDDDSEMILTRCSERGLWRRRKWR